MSTITVILTGILVWMISLAISLAIALQRSHNRERDLMDRILEMSGTRPLTPIEKTLVDTAQKEAQKRKEIARLSFKVPRS